MTNQKIRESLNKLDRIALDECTEYYDLLNLYEAMKPLSNDEQKAISDAVKTKNPDTINATMSKVMMDRDPSLKNRANKLTMSATTMESLDEESLDNIDDEPLEEGRNNLKPVQCQAIKSHKKYWSPYDTKENEFAQYGTRFRYDSKDACKDAIADPDNTLGYEDNKQKLDRVKSSENPIKESILDEAAFSPCAGGPFIVQTYYDSKAGKIRVVGDDGVNGQANVAFPNNLRNNPGEYYIVSRMGWNGKNYKVNANDVISKPSSGTIGPVNAQNIQPQQPQQSQQPVQDVPETEPEVEDEYNKSVNTKVTGWSFKRPAKLEEDEEFEPNRCFFGSELIDYNKLSQETQAFIQKPINGKGELFPQAKALMILYNECYNNNKPYVNRGALLDAAGVPNPYRAGQASTWFTEFGLLGLAILQSGDVYPGQNLKGWVEGTVQPTGAKRVKGNYVPIGPGNPGIDLRPYINSTYTVRNSQGLQPDRSHGKGDTTLHNNSAQSAAPTQNTASNDYEKAVNTKVSGWSFKRQPKVETTEELEIDSDKVEEPISFVDTEREARLKAYKDQRNQEIRKQYREEYDLNEEVEITEADFGCDKLKRFCWKNGLNIDAAKEALLGDK